MTVCPNCSHEFDVTAQWPPGVFEVAVEVFGPSVQNENGRTRKTLNSKIEHALREWAKRYGDPLNAQQLTYASSVLCMALRAGEGVERNQQYPRVYAAIDRMRNHEKVHAGFKRRAGFVDVRTQMQEAFA